MCFALFMLMLDNTVVNVALPSIQRDLNASLSALEWTVNAYTLTLAVLMITSGRLADIFGRRRLFLIGVSVFGISSLVLGLAPNVGVLVAFRAIQGVGAACMMPASLAIITQAFPPHQRGTAIGTWAGVSALALAIGPVLGGFLTEDVSWRAIFFINPPIAVIAIAVTLFAARESRDETVDRTVDYAGIVLLTVGLTSLVLSLIEGNRWHWGSPPIIGLWIIAAVALVLFFRTEARVRAPMLDLAFFRNRTSAGVNLVAFIISFALFAQFFFLTLYMQNVLHLSPLETGIRFLPTTVVLVVMGPVSGRLTDRIGPRPLMTAGHTDRRRFDLHREPHHCPQRLPASAAGVHPDGLRHGPCDVTDDHGRHERRRSHQGGSGVRRVVDEPYGRQHLRRRGDGRDRHNRRAVQARSEPAAAVRRRERNAIVSGLGSGATGAGHASAEIVSAVERAFVSALSTGFLIGSAVTLVASLIAWKLIEQRPAAPEPKVDVPSRPEQPVSG